MRRSLCVLFTLTLLLSACTPSTAVSGGETTPPTISETSSEVQIPTPTQPESLPESSDESPSQVSSNEDVLKPEEPRKDAVLQATVGSSITAAMRLSYADDGMITFKQTIQNKSGQALICSPDFTVERFREGIGWELVSGQSAGGNRPLSPGQAAVLEGVLPITQEEAAEGLKYRVVRGLIVEQPEPGQEKVLTLVSYFTAGHTFIEGEKTDETLLAQPAHILIATDTDHSGKGLVRFSQTVTNNSTQTITMGHTYEVIRYKNEKWIPAKFPKDMEPIWTEEAITLLPGQSFETAGILPFTAEQAKRGGQYQILRKAYVQNPVEGQLEILELITEFTAGPVFLFTDPNTRNAQGKLTATAETVEFSLKQNVYEAGQTAILHVEILNASDFPVKIKPIGVKGGSNMPDIILKDKVVELLPGQSKKVLIAEIPRLLAGEYVLEAQLSVENSDPIPLIAKFIAE